MTQPIRVLFVCTGNSARSLMAEALLRRHGGDRFEVFSAGTEPRGVNPLTLRVLHEAGIDASTARSKSVSEFLGQPFDYVVSPVSPIAGSNRVTPMSYSPQTGYFYAQGVASLGRARHITSDPWFRGNAPMLDMLPPSVGTLAAIDGRTNKIVWKRDMPSTLGTSGPLTTAGGLMFRGDADGSVQAYDAKTGEPLWQFQTGLRGARGPAMSYEIDGEQYIAVAMGTSLWSFKLGGSLLARPAPTAVTNRGPLPEPTRQVEKRVSARRRQESAPKGDRR